jgi:hypothetical protein
VNTGDVGIVNVKVIGVGITQFTLKPAATYRNPAGNPVGVCEYIHVD